MLEGVATLRARHGRQRAVTSDNLVVRKIDDENFRARSAEHTEAKFPAGSIVLESMGYTWPHSE